MIGKMVIAGVDRSASVQFSTVEIRNNLNSQVDTLDFSLLKYGTFTFKPIIGQEVQYILTDPDEVEPDEVIFGGIIMQIEESFEGNGTLSYQVSASDYAQLLDRQLVSERYTDMTAGEIVEALRDTYATDFTIDGVDAPVEVASIAFNRIPMQQALNRLAQLTGYQWYVDETKDIHFFPKDGEAAPFNLTDTSNNYIPKTLKLRSDLSQIRNTVYVRGGETVAAAPRSEYLTGDGEKTEWPLVYRYAQQPQVFVDGVEKTVLPDNLYDFDDADFLWSQGQQYLRTATLYTTADNGIEVIGVPYVPIIVRVYDPGSISTYGVWEFAIEDKRIKSAEEAKQYALAQLESYKRGVKEGEFSTYTPGLRSGQTITITSALRGVNQEFMIQSVGYRAIARDKHEWQVTLATTRTIGLVEILQGLLQQESIEEDGEFPILVFAPFEDNATASESVSFSSTVGPYVWGEEDPVTADELTSVYGGDTWDDLPDDITWDELFVLDFGGGQPWVWNFSTWDGD